MNFALITVYCTDMAYKGQCDNNKYYLHYFLIILQKQWHFASG